MFMKKQWSTTGYLLERDENIHEYHIIIHNYLKNPQVANSPIPHGTLLVPGPE